MRFEIFLRVGAFQPYSSPTSDEEINKKVGGERVERVERVEEKNVEEKKDCKIIGSSKKRAAPRKKPAPEKKPTQVEVKVEGEDGNWNRLDSKVYQLIALKGEMEPEFERNGRKQSE
jgi:hypothetical protein